MSDSNEKRVMIITGQNNRYKMKEVINGGIKPEKTIRTKMKNVDEDLFLGKQVDMINKMYTNPNANHDAILKKELELKINGYKQQDIMKNIYDSNLLITFDEVVEKLVISKLKCYYCSCKLLLLYKNSREPTQWTLDRKYNDECHSNENTLISCLKCNLERRLKNVDKFTFTKKLRIKKEM